MVGTRRSNALKTPPQPVSSRKRTKTATEVTPLQGYRMASCAGHSSSSSPSSLNRNADINSSYSNANAHGNPPIPTPAAETSVPWGFHRTEVPLADLRCGVCVRCVWRWVRRRDTDRGRVPYGRLCACGGGVDLGEGGCEHGCYVSGEEAQFGWVGNEG